MIPAANIAGMVFSLIVAFGLPIALCVALRVKTKAKFLSLMAGCTVFVLFVLFLENILHELVLWLTGTLISDNLFLYALYGGLAAAAFEETGRWLAMRFTMRKCLTRENALMYGVGHGGTEAMLLLGITSINNLANSLLINDGSMIQVLDTLDAAAAQSALTSLSALWTTPAYLFFLAGIERILAIILQIALSVIMYRAVKEKDRRFYWAAFGIHFGVDFMIVLLAGVSAVLAEAVLLAAVAAVCWYAAKLYKAEK